MTSGRLSFSFIGSVLLSFSLISSYARASIISVVDQDTSRPIPDVSVEIQRYIPFVGCREDSIYKTNSTGQITIESHGDSLAATVCAIHAEKTGYHPNGKNPSKSGILSEHSDTSPRAQTIRLQKIQNPQELFKKQLEFQQGDRANFLSAILDRDSRKIKRIPSNVNQTDEIDFDFPIISNEAQERNAIGRGFAKIRFYGNGGIQQLPGGEGSDYAGNRFYPLENLIHAPKDGYVQELMLAPGGQYVARLRDGKHYVKFTSHLITKYLSGVNFARLIFYIQPLATDRLESIDTLYPWKGISVDPTVNQFNVPENVSSNWKFRVLTPKNGERYLYGTDVLFSGRARPGTLIFLALSERHARWSVKADADGNWATTLAEVDSINEILSLNSEQERNITINDGKSTSQIRYTVGHHDGPLRRVNTKLFHFDVPINLLVEARSGAKADPERLFVRLNEATTLRQMSAFNAWQGEEKDFEMRAGEQWKNAREHWPEAELKKYDLGKFKGYRIKNAGENSSLDYTRGIFLYYKNLIVRFDLDKGQETPPEEIYTILNSIGTPSGE